MRLVTLSAVLVLIGARIASAHEFWIEPEDFTIDKGDEVVAAIRVGQNFEGGNFPFIPANIARFELMDGDRVVAVRSRIGDRPALHQALDAEGLWVIVHETTDQRLTYVEEGLFEGFVEHKDLEGVLEAHAARGLPMVGFTENYRRFAKSLVAVGNGEGADMEMGLRTEVIALDNPYLADYDGEMSVKLMFEGAPRTDAQVEIFSRAPNGTVMVGTTRTDDQGIAHFPTEPGYVYLADAVKMVPLEGDGSDGGAVWYSLWASLTFAVPK